MEDDLIEPNLYELLDKLLIEKQELNNKIKELEKKIKKLEENK